MFWKASVARCQWSGPAGATPCTAGSRVAVQGDMGAYVGFGVGVEVERQVVHVRGFCYDSVVMHLQVQELYHQAAQLNPHMAEAHLMLASVVVH